jgi:hypothetical protein
MFDSLKIQEGEPVCVTLDFDQKYYNADEIEAIIMRTGGSGKPIEKLGEKLEKKLLEAYRCVEI